MTPTDRNRTRGARGARGADRVAASSGRGDASRNRSAAGRGVRPRDGRRRVEPRRPADHDGRSGRPAWRACGGSSSRPRRSSRPRSATNCGGGTLPWRGPRRAAAGGRATAAGVRRRLRNDSIRRRWSDALAAEGVAVEQQTMDCLIAATDHLAAEALKPNTLAALASRHAAAACAWRTGIRASAPCWRLDPARAAAATADVGANLLVIDPAAGTLFQWKQMLIGVLPRRGPPLSGGNGETVGIDWDASLETTRDHACASAT